MKIAIIGAGVTGLTLAKLLTNKGLKIDVFDKGRGVGGRTSSRRTEWGYLDHGCQYITIKNRLFQEFCHDYSSTIKQWQGKFARWENGTISIINDEKVRYIFTKSMSNFCKEIAVNLDVKISCKIITLEKDNQWNLIDENNNKYLGYDWVIITAPPQQTADLLLTFTPFVEDIKNIKMLPCFSLMLVLEREINSDLDGLELQHPVLGWIGFNHRKYPETPQPRLIIQSNFSWANYSLECDRTQVQETMKIETEKILGQKLDNLLYESLHLWRYALPAKDSEQKYYLDGDNKIGVCGDWCLKGKVESGFLSSYFLKEAIMEYL